MIDIRDVMITGIVATALADLWQLALSRVTALPVADWRLRTLGWMDASRHIYTSGQRTSAP